MKKSCNFDGPIEYELLGTHQQDFDLRGKMALIYASPYSDALWWELRDPSLASHGFFKLYYYEQSVLQHIILFKYSAYASKKIFVVNQQFKISSNHIKNISHILFKEFDTVQEIIFEKMYEPLPLQSPRTAFEISWFNDVIISDLPNSMDEYKKTLTKNARHKINNVWHRIERDLPDLKVLHYEKSEITFEQIEKLISLFKERLITKKRKPAQHDTDAKMIYQYATTSGYGYLCECNNNGEFVSGMINYVIGEHAYGHIIAHDDSNNIDSFGFIAFINSIKYLIDEKKVKYFHLGSGQQDYKFRLGGVSNALHIIRVFRNYNIYYFRGKLRSNFIDIHRKFEMKFMLEYLIRERLKKLKRKYNHLKEKN